MRIPGHGGIQEGGGALLFLVRQDLAKGDAGGLVNADVDELPAGAAFTGRTAITLAGAIDAMADAVETAAS
ncbi:hypothetical protein ATY81_17675 [Rhizobium sp. R72]|nr:hypothetical protein ATY81_17675 [Rhizobium sp. R72]OWW04355.1 hypothetical protein ATY80_17675 [Rhizobium sp. R711]